MFKDKVKLPVTLENSHWERWSLTYVSFTMPQTIIFEHFHIRYLVELYWEIQFEFSKFYLNKNTQKCYIILITF